MAKKAKTLTKKERRKSTQRRERRFVPLASANPWLVRGLGGVAALVLGAGIWAYFYAKSFGADDDKLKMLPTWLIAGGAVVLGIAIWLGTSSDPPVRVGDPGIALERGDTRRMPWWAVDSITFQSGSLTLAIVGKDESSKEWSFNVPLKTHPEAIAWIVQEALDRIPKKVDISDELLEKLPRASEHAGLVVNLEPLQVVGRKDAVTGKTISYEPDAAVCPRCERVYFKRSVPKKCKCGASLAHLGGAAKSTEDDEDGGESASDETNEDDKGEVEDKENAET